MPMKRTHAAVMAALMALTGAWAGDPVTLTSREGKALTGEWVRTDAKIVVIKVEGRGDVTIPISLLSVESRRQVLLECPFLHADHPKITGVIPAKDDPRYFYGVDRALKYMRGPYHKDDIDDEMSFGLWKKLREAHYDKEKLESVIKEMSLAGSERRRIKRLLGE